MIALASTGDVSRWTEHVKCLLNRMLYLKGTKTGMFSDPELSEYMFIIMNET